MSNHLNEMTIRELKTYIKENRHDEKACHEALKRLMSLKNPNNPQYSYNLPPEEMEAIFKAKLQSSSQ